MTTLALLSYPYCSYSMFYYMKSSQRFAEPIEKYTTLSCTPHSAPSLLFRRQLDPKTATLDRGQEGSELYGVSAQLLSLASVSCFLHPVFACPSAQRFWRPARLALGGGQGRAPSRHPADGQAGIWQARPSPWKTRGFLLR